MNIGKILKGVVAIVVPAAATAIGGPVAGGVAATVVGGLVGGEVAYQGGKKAEAVTGRPVQKVAGPLGITAGAALVMQFLPVDLYPAVCGFAEKACENPTALAGTLFGVLLWALQYAIRVIRKVSAAPNG